MFSFRNKWVYSALLLTASGGASFPFLKNKFHSNAENTNKSSVNIRSNEFSGNDNRLNLSENQLGTIDLNTLRSDSSRSHNINLGTGPSQLEISENDLESFGPERTINGIRTEIIKDNVLHNISEEHKKNVEKEEILLENEKMHYQLASTKVNIYNNRLNDSNKMKKPRTSSEIQDQHLDPLHRIAIARFYSSYSKLDETKGKLLDQLKTVALGQEEIFEINSEQLALIKKAHESLEKIGWYVRIPHIKLFGDVSNQSKENSYGWINWNQNPFNVFFENEQNWLKKMERIDNDLKGYLQQFEFENCDKKNLSPVCKIYQARVDALMEDTKSEIELEIASWLLKTMQQLKKERKVSEAKEVVRTEKKKVRAEKTT